MKGQLYRQGLTDLLMDRHDAALHVISKKDQRGRRATQNVWETAWTETRVLNRTHRELVADGQSRPKRRVDRVRGLKFFKGEK